MSLPEDFNIEAFKQFAGKQLNEINTLQLADDGLRENTNGYLYWYCGITDGKKTTAKACVFLSKRASRTFAKGDRPVKSLRFITTVNAAGEERLKLGFGETNFVLASELEEL